MSKKSELEKLFELTGISFGNPVLDVWYLSCFALMFVGVVTILP